MAWELVKESFYEEFFDCNVGICYQIQGALGNTADAPKIIQ